eukprot:3432220-Amphidinium_carterae.1
MLLTAQVTPEELGRTVTSGGCISSWGCGGYAGGRISGDGVHHLGQPQSLASFSWGETSKSMGALVLSARGLANALDLQRRSCLA